MSCTSSSSCLALVSRPFVQVEGHWIHGGEPADRPPQVDVGFEDRTARSAEVDGDGTVTNRGRDRPASAASMMSSIGSRSLRRTSSISLVSDALSVADSRTRSSTPGASGTSWLATRRVALVTVSSQKSRLSTTRGMRGERGAAL